MIGAGVAGLSTALRLLEAGHAVRVVTADDPLATTSSVAAALWYPYRAYPQDRVLGWARRAFEVFAQLAHDPETGVVLRDGVEVLGPEAPELPWWAGIVPDVRACEPVELPRGAQRGWAFRVPVIAMPAYLRWLVTKTHAAGGVIERARVGSLAAACAGRRVVVNCAGLGARDLAADGSVLPVQGQVLRVRNPGLTRFLLDEGETLTYIVPRGEDCVLGGTAVEGSWSLEADPEVAAAILRRCVAYEPRLAGSEIVEHKVGLRPARPEVRVEVEEVGGACCVHHYGHGGAGVTLSWGTAEETAHLVAEQLA